jgi:hypothetical protein
MKTEKFFLAKLNFKSKNPTYFSDLEVWVSSRTFDAGYLYTNSPYVYGILEAIDGLGQSMGEVLPDDRYGSLVLNSDRGSYKAKGRIYDLLDKYSIINQDVTIYSFQKKDSQIGNSSDLEVEFIGVASRAFANTQEAKMTIEVRSENISNVELLARVNNDIFPNAITGAIGRQLPVFFGNTDFISPGLFTEVTPTTAKLVFTSTVGNDYKYLNTELKIFFKDDAQNNREVTSTAGVTTSDSFFVNDGGTSFGFGVLDGGLSRIGLRILSQNKIVTAIRIYAGRMGTTWNLGLDSEFIIILYEMLRGNKVGRELTRGTRNKVDFSTQIKQSGSGWNEVLIPLETPIPMIDSRGYFFAIDQSRDNAINNGSISLGSFSIKFYDFVVLRANDDSSILTLIYEPNDPDQLPTFDNINYWKTVVGSVEIETYGVEFDMNSSANVFSDNIGFQEINFSQLLIPDLNQELLPNFADLTPLISCKGLRDINGVVVSANSIISNASDVVRFLAALSLIENNKSIPSNLNDLVDITSFSVASKCGNISGIWQSGSIRSVLAEILDNSSSRLAPKRSGGFRMWTYGADDSPVKIINESDCMLESLSVTGEDEIVNRLSIVYDLREVNGNYLKSKNKQDLASINFYGTKDLSSDNQELNFVKEDSQAERWLDYKLARFSKERLQITVTIPYWKDMYRQIELLDKIIISHVALPSHYGSGTADEERPITTDGDSLGADYNLGDLWRRAKSLPLRVIGRNPIFSEGSEPMIQLKLEGIEQ